MKSLLLTGYKIHIGVDDGKLIIKDGRDFEKKPTEIVYKPKFIDIDQIVLYGHTGNVSISAMKWLMKHKVPIHLMDYDGTLLSTMNPPQSKIGSVRLGQYRAYEEKRVDIAKEFIEAKILRTKDMFEWLLERYPDLKKQYDLCNFDKVLSDLGNVSQIREIMGLEGQTARHFWDGVKQTFPDKFEFDKRGIGKTDRPLGAVDPINALFNYGYAYLEGLCRKAINTANLDPYIGFLHETNSTKEPLVYDLQEPFRWLVDFTIIQALERKVFHKKDFIRTEDYIIRIRPEGVKKLVSCLDLSFSQKISYKKIHSQWGNIILLKAQELSNYLSGKKKDLSFSSPKPSLERVDNQEIRKKILSLSYVEWKEMGFSKGTLHQLKVKVKENKTFTLNAHVRQRLNSIV